MGAHSTPTGGTASHLHCLAPWGRDLPLCHGDQSQRGAPKGRGDPSVPPRCAVGHLLCYGVVTPRGHFISIMGISMPWGPPCAMGKSMPWGPISTMGTHLCHGDPTAPWGHPCHGDPTAPWGHICAMGTHLHHRDPFAPLGCPCHGAPSVPWGTFCAMGTHLHCGDPSVPQGQPVPLLSRRDPTAPHRCHP